MKASFWQRAAESIGRYLEDLLAVAAGACFTAAAGLLFGAPIALAAAGACLGVYSAAVARSKGGK